MYKLEIEIGIVFVNEQNFKEQTKFFVNDGVVQKKMNDGRTTWIVQRNERTIVFLNERKKNERSFSYLTNIFIKILKKR